MALTPDQQVLLAKYRAAYASLISGDRVAEVTSNGRTIKYGPPDIARLEREIARLEVLAAGIRGRGALNFTL